MYIDKLLLRFSRTNHNHSTHTTNAFTVTKNPTYPSRLQQTCTKLAVSVSMLSVLKGSELPEKLSLEELLPYMEREKDEVDRYVKSVESLQVCLKQSGFTVGIMSLESACEAKVGEYILFHTDCRNNIGFCYLLGGCRYIFETDCKRTVMNMDLKYGF
jgi:hypothetical protein